MSDATQKTDAEKIQSIKEGLGLSDKEISDIFGNSSAGEVPSGDITRLRGVSCLLSAFYKGRKNPAQDAYNYLETIHPNEDKKTALNMITTGDSNEIKTATKFIQDRFENDI